MNEVALAGRPPRIKATKKTKQDVPSSKSDFKIYLLMALLAVLGYLLRDWKFINPEQGTGYWLGIMGGSLMLFLLLYPLRKRVRLLQLMGTSKQWFRMHLLLGLVGPLMVLYHCNFSLGSFNSRFALYCMLLVAGSGLIGRHIYAGIHRGLYGRRTSLQELQKELAESLENSRGLAKVSPLMVQRLTHMSAELQGCEITQSLNIGRSLKWTFMQPFVVASLYLSFRYELKAAAKRSDIVARNYDRILDASLQYIRTYTRLMGRVAQFSFYERLFALWHILHYPIFLLMIVSALFHVLAVHMY